MNLSYDVALRLAETRRIREARAWAARAAVIREWLVVQRGTWA